MKKVLLGMMMLGVMGANAQSITTQSSCDSNGDGKVDVSDVTNTANKVIAKSASEQNVVTAEQLNNVLTGINSKLEAHSDELRILRACLTSIAEKVGAKTPEEIEEEKYNGHEYVDLGLSVKWATCNVGAEKPEEYGDYFAWGETTGYTSDTSDGRSFDWASLKYCGSTTFKGTLTKYVASSTYGTVDNLTTLEATDDAASTNWGGDWRMPTNAEQTELRNGCYWEWTDNYNSTGKAGYIIYKVKSDSDKGVNKYSGSTTTVVGTYTISDTHIFLPAAGVRSGSGLYNVGFNGHYWSNSLNSSESNHAYDLYLGSSEVGWSSALRYGGQSVRPVCQ